MSGAAALQDAPPQLTQLAGPVPRPPGLLLRPAGSQCAGRTDGGPSVVGFGRRRRAPGYGAAQHLAALARRRVSIPARGGRGPPASASGHVAGGNPRLPWARGLAGPGAVFLFRVGVAPAATAPSPRGAPNPSCAPVCCRPGGSPPAAALACGRPARPAPEERGLRRRLAPVLAAAGPQAAAALCAGDCGARIL